jgi:hypothetical protein
MEDPRVCDGVCDEFESVAEPIVGGPLVAVYMFKDKPGDRMISIVRNISLGLGSALVLIRFGAGI